MTMNNSLLNFISRFANFYILFLISKINLYYLTKSFLVVCFTVGYIIKLSSKQYEIFVQCFKYLIPLNSLRVLQ